MITDKTSDYFPDYTINSKNLTSALPEEDSIIQNLRRVSSLPENLPPLSLASPAIRPRCYSFQGTLIATRNQQGDLLVKDMNISQLLLIGDVQPLAKSYFSDLNNNNLAPNRGNADPSSIVIKMPENESWVHGKNSRNSHAMNIFTLSNSSAFPSRIAQVSPQGMGNDYSVIIPQQQDEVSQGGGNGWANQDLKNNMDALQQHASNIGKALSRNLLSVAIPTAMREYMAKNVLPVLLRNAPGTASIALAGIAIAAPIALQLLGIARDLHAGTQTRESLSARLANIALVTGAGSALVATGGVAAAANALIAAVFVYVPLRDALQYFLKLGDDNKPTLNLKVCSESAAVYTANQVLVSEGMTLLANALEPLLGKTVANMVGKALVNTVGETADEMTYRTFNSWEQKNPGVEFSLTIRPAEEVNVKTATDMLLNTIAARSALFATTFAAAGAAPFSGVLNSIVIGAALGAGYLPFFFNHAQSPADPLDLMEAGQGGF